MATTSNYGWTTPDDSAPVSLGAAAIRSLGTAIDATVYANAQAAVGTAALPLGTATPSDGDVLTFGSGVWDAAAPSVGSGYVYAGGTVFSASGSFSKADPLGTGDIGLRAIRVRVVGGGGGTGSADATTVGQASAGAGGGGGGFAERFYTDVAGMDATVTVTVGAGGSGGVSAAEGTAGGVSEFGGSGDAWRVRATGGSNGARTGATSGFPNGRRGGQPGVGTNGDLLLGGTAGSFGFIQGSTTFANYGGSGGASVLGGGGYGGQSSDAQAGRPYGGGAGHPGNSASATARDGEAGGAGIVIIDCYV